MKKLFSTKYLTTVLFLLLLAVSFLMSIVPFLYGCRVAAWDLLYKHTLNLSVIEELYQDSFCGKNFFVTLNGGFQRLMGAREINQRYRLDNGHISYVIGEIDVDGIASNTVDFRNALQELGIPMLYVNTPFKICEFDKQLPDSIEDYSNENANRFLAVLADNGVTYLDLRRSIAEDNLDHYSLFFPSDHHWQPETGFWATFKIIDRLTELDSSFAVDAQITDFSHYNQTVCEGVFLGSAGRRVGPLYSGFDDITLITPKYETKFSFSVPAKGILREGSFEDSFLFPEALTPEDIFNSNGYGVYCGDDYGLLKLRNDTVEPSATAKKVLLIKDSFSNVIIPFLNAAYEELHVVDLRYLEKDLMSYIEEFQPDLVLTVYNPGAYNTDNLVLFDFLK